MKQILTALTFTTALLLAGTGVSYAEVHASEALKHAQLGSQHGRKGHADILTTHMKEALEHAKASQKAHSDRAAHMGEAITHLNAAIEHGKMGHADVATKHAKEAIVHIKAGNK